MQFDGFPVEKWRAQMMGAIEISEAEGLAMRTDKTVVMVVATRIRKSVPEVLDEDGIVRITRQNKIEHLVVLEGDQREQAMKLLAEGSDRGFPLALDFTAPAETGDPQVDSETGEVISGGFAAYAEPEPSPSSPTPPAAAGVTPVENGQASGFDDGVRSPIAEPTPSTTGPSSSSDAVDEFEVGDSQPGAPPLATGPADRPTVVARGVEEPEYFDVPPVTDDREPVAHGNVHDYRDKARREPTGSSGEGMKVGKVDYATLASIGNDTGPSDPAAPPRGEVIGSVHRSGRRGDAALEAFFHEDVNPDE